MHALPAPDISKKFEYTRLEGDVCTYTEPSFEPDEGKHTRHEVEHKIPLHSEDEQKEVKYHVYVHEEWKKNSGELVFATAPKRVLKGGGRGKKHGKEEAPGYCKIYSQGRLLRVFHLDGRKKKHGIELVARKNGTIREIVLWRSGVVVKRWTAPVVQEGGTLDDNKYLSLRLTFSDADDRKTAKEELSRGRVYRKTTFWPSGKTQEIVCRDKQGRVTQRIPHNTKGQKHGEEVTPAYRPVTSWDEVKRHCTVTWDNGVIVRLKVPEDLPGWGDVKKTDVPGVSSHHGPPARLRHAMLQSLKTTGAFDLAAGLRELERKVVEKFQAASAKIVEALTKKPNHRTIESLCDIARETKSLGFMLQRHKNENTASRKQRKRRRDDCGASFFF